MSIAMYNAWELHVHVHMYAIQVMCKNEIQVHVHVDIAQRKCTNGCQWFSLYQSHTLSISVWTKNKDGIPEDKTIHVHVRHHSVNKQSVAH